MTKRLKEIRINRNIKNKPEVNEYFLKLRKKHFPWWIFLLLLPLLLLIKCSKDITVTCVDADSNELVAGLPVTMKYTSHFLFDEGQFFKSNDVKITQTTDSAGKTVFKGLRFSVFSYIFYFNSQVTFEAKDECRAAEDESYRFHTTSDVEIKMKPRYEDLHFRLVDLEDGYVLPDGTVQYKRKDKNGEKEETAEADADGVVTIPHVRYCGDVEFIKGSCYGYADTIAEKVPAKQLIAPNDSNALKLRPIKKKITFFVKNKDTKQPIPDATCNVKLKNPKTGKTASSVVHTSTDGRGIAVYDDAFILAELEIDAKKTHFKDGKLEGGPWTVDKFIKQDDNTRTIWLEPDPYMMEFQNVDSITKKPISGVKNEITITTPGGKTSKDVQTSNKNGIFPVSAEDGSKIEIISTKDPDYFVKKTFIKSFGKKEIILMRPKTVTFAFKTVDKDDGSLLPSCNLSIKGSISGSLKPTSSGNGEFNVEMINRETLTIVATKKGYKKNDYTVKRVTEAQLQSPQKRIIPLEKEPPPPPPPPSLPKCNGGNEVPKGSDENYHQQSYNMGVMSGRASITFNFYEAEDWLTVYDGVGTSGKVLIPKQSFSMTNDPIYDKTLWFNFTQGAITVVVESDGGSDWRYMVNCP